MKDVVAIRIPNWIGDAVLSLPFVKNVKEVFKNYKIILVMREKVKDVFKNNPYYDKIVIINDKKYSIISAIIEGIKLRQYRIKIFFILPDSFSSALIGFFSNARIRAGYKNEFRDIFLNFKLNKPEKVIHRSEKYLNILSEFLKKNKIKKIKFSKEAEIFLTEKEIKFAKEYLKNIKGKIVGINPNASAISRRWFKERFALLADKLIERLNVNVIFFGSKNETDYVSELIKYVRHPVYNFAGKLSLREYIAILKELDLFITNDSGPMHLANIVGTPVIAIEGAADINETGMINPGIKIYVFKNLPCSPCVKNICPYNLECLYAISVDDVFKYAEKVLYYGKSKNST